MKSWPSPRVVPPPLPPRVPVGYRSLPREMGRVGGRAATRRWSGGAVRRRAPEQPVEQAHVHHGATRRRIGLALRPRLCGDCDHADRREQLSGGNRAGLVLSAGKLLGCLIQDIDANLKRRLDSAATAVLDGLLERHLAKGILEEVACLLRACEHTRSHELGRRGLRTTQPVAENAPTDRARPTHRPPTCSRSCTTRGSSPSGTWTSAASVLRWRTPAAASPPAGAHQTQAE